MSPATDDRLRYVRLARIATPAPGAAVAVTVGGRAIALVNVDGRVLALEDGCLRCCASFAGGRLDGGRLACRCGWTYDLATGELVGGTHLRLERYPVGVDAEGVMVGLPHAAEPVAR